MVILTEHHEVLNFDHYRKVDIQQRVRMGTTFFELTAHQSTTSSTDIIRAFTNGNDAEEAQSDFFNAIKTKKTVWDAEAFKSTEERKAAKPPKAEPAPPSDAPPASDDASIPTV